MAVVFVTPHGYWGLVVTIINELKKEPKLQAVNHDFLAIYTPDQIARYYKNRVLS